MMSLQALGNRWCVGNDLPSRIGSDRSLQPGPALALVVCLAITGCASTQHGRSHYPQASQPTHGKGIYERGDATFYDASFAGHRTASGERFDPHALTAAHRSLPLGSRVRVTDLDNNRHVTVRINDRGPFTAGRIIDLSPRAAKRLHMTADGTAPVTLRIVSEPDG